MSGDQFCVVVFVRLRTLAASIGVLGWYSLELLKFWSFGVRLCCTGSACRRAQLLNTEHLEYGYVVVLEYVLARVVDRLSV